MSDHLLACDHAVSLSNGRIVEPYGAISSDEIGAEDRWIRDDDLLIDAPVPPEELKGDALKQRARDLGIEGYSDMLADDLRKAVADASKGGK